MDAVDSFGRNDPTAASYNWTIGTPPTFAFASANNSVGEGAGSAAINISRLGSSAGAVSVHFATANGTATAGSDYTAVSQTVSFAAGQTSKTVSIPITNDSLAEGDETVILSLSSPSSGCVLGSPKAAGLTIVDNETTPTFFLAGTSYSVNEGAGSLAIAVKRSGSTSTAKTVVIKTANSTATAGSDYTAVSQTLSFAAGQTYKTVSIPIINDTLAEGDESFSVSLSSPSSGSVLGTQKTASDSRQRDDAGLLLTRDELHGQRGGRLGLDRAQALGLDRAGRDGRLQDRQRHRYGGKRLHSRLPDHHLRRRRVTEGPRHPDHQRRDPRGQRDHPALDLQPVVGIGARHAEVGHADDRGQRLGRRLPLGSRKTIKLLCFRRQVCLRTRSSLSSFRASPLAARKGEIEDE